VVTNTKKFKSVRAAAEKAFFTHGLQNTVDKTGVLIFLSVEERKIEILGDEGINAKIEQSTWDSFVEKLAIKIREGQPAQGICDLIAEIGVILTQYFPIQPDDENELSNDVIIED
jgi:putative membrane protein